MSNQDSTPASAWLDLVNELLHADSVAGLEKACYILATRCGLTLSDWKSFEEASPSEVAEIGEAQGAPGTTSRIHHGEAGQLSCLLYTRSGGALLRLETSAAGTGRELEDAQTLATVAATRLHALEQSTTRLEALEAAERIVQEANVANGVAMETLCGASQVNTHVASVAAATEEMAATIQEISRSAGDSADVARSATQLSEAASTSMERLKEASTTIGKVTQLIGKLASQTNLLALNARVEAARAGDAGMGFAVVAGEVKGLAHKTTGATSDIEEQIEAVQALVGATAQDISSVAEVISKVDQYAGSIAAAVNEQGAAVQEITNTVAAAAAQLDGVVERLSDVGEATMGFERDARICVNAL